MAEIPPIDFEQDKELEPLQEVTEVSFTGCRHKQVKYVNDELRCSCGASWSGARLAELYKMLTS